MPLEWALTVSSSPGFYLPALLADEQQISSLCSVG
jgi:hypothetical protein